MIIDPDDHPDRHSTDRAKHSEAFADAARRLKNLLRAPQFKRVYVMVGVAGSGKSTKAKELDQDPNRSLHFIVDGCHTNANLRRALAGRIKDEGKVPIAVHMKTPPAESLRRNNARQPPKRVPSQVIARQHRELEIRPPRRAEGWAEVIEVKP
jgi:predicted kinase